MADVVLNLIYNDNGAQKNVDNLVRTLQAMETKHYSINIDTREIKDLSVEAQKLTKNLDNVKNSVLSINNAFNGRAISTTFNELEVAVSRFEKRVQDSRLAIVNFYTSLAAKKNLGFEIDEKAASEQLVKLKNNLRLSREEANIARAQFEQMGKAIDVSGITGSIDAIAKKMASVGTGIYPENIKSMEDFSSDMTGKMSSSKFSKMRSSANNAWKGRFGYYVQERRAILQDTEKEAELFNNFKNQVEAANKEIAVGNRQTWRGIYQVITGTIHSLTAIYNTWKSAVTAPLNLTGVSQFASMITSMEGSLLLNQISSNITTGFANSVERFDILQTFPAVMEAVGFSADQSTEAMNRLYQSVLGLPTAFEDIVSVAQYFALVLGDLDKATDLAIAANNAFVASGATSQQITSGMRQLQYIIDGTKLRSTQWYSLIRSMPVALREVGKALGYPDFNSFTADLMGNKIAADTLIDSLIDVGLHSEKIAGVIDVMKTRVQAALDNVRNAAKRMGNAMLEALDETLKRTGGKGIAENIKGVSGILDRIAQVSAEWISNNGDKIQALIDKFMSINWEDIIPKLFDGLAEFADKALDNINEMLDKIPELLTTTSQWINDFENSAFFRWISGGGSIISGGAQIGLGISNLVLGTKTRTAANAILAELGVGKSASIFGGAGASLSGIGGVAGAGAIAGAIALGITNIIDLAYQLIDKGWKEGSAEYISHWKWSTPLGPAYDALKDFMISESSGNGNFMESPLRTIIEWMTGLKNNGALSEYRLRNLSSSKVGDIASRYSAYPFANKDTIAMLEALQTALTLGSADSDLLNKDISRITSSMNLADEIAKPYDAAIDALESKKEDIIKEIDKINEEIAKKFSGVDVNIFTFYKKLYDNSKKYFSEQFEEANGWGYSNTTRDRAEFLEKNLPEITGLIDEITQYALENYSDDEGVLAVVAQFMADFDWNDPEQLAVLVKNYGGKSMQEVFEQYFEQQAKNLDLDEAIQNALLNSQLKFKENELEAIDIEQKHLEEERESALAPVIEMIEDDMEVLEGDFDSVVESTKQAGKRIVDALEGLFNSLSSAKPKSSLNSFFQGIYNTIISWRNRILPILPTSNSFKVSPYNDNLLGQGSYSATGGFMFAPHGTDTIPAMLTPGEYVQRRAAVEHFGRIFMDRINALDLRGALRSLQIATPYSTGGFIKNETRNYRDNHAVVNQTFNNSSMNYGMRRANRFVRALG